MIFKDGIGPILPNPIMYNISTYLFVMFLFEILTIFIEYVVVCLMLSKKEHITKIDLFLAVFVANLISFMVGLAFFLPLLFGG
jgi:hypothetical protein